MKTYHTTFLLTACTALLSITQFANAGDILFQTNDLFNINGNAKNITYHTTPYGKDLKLNIFQPKQKNGGMEVPELKPVMIFLHSYGSNKDNKTINRVPKRFTKSGYVSMSINYDGEPNSTGQGGVEGWFDNLAECIKWTRNADNANKYGIDPNRILIGGSSQGAYVSSYVAYDESRLDKPVQGLLTMSGGITDDVLAAYQLGENPMNEGDFSPAIFHTSGDIDKTYEIEWSDEFFNKATAPEYGNSKGHYAVLKGTGHTGNNGIAPFNAFLNGVGQPNNPADQSLAFFYDQLDLENIIVPEPSTFALAGLLMLGGLSRKTRKKSA